MEDFTVTTTLTKEEYRKVFFLGYYKKPFIIIINLLGIYFLIMAIKDYQNIIDVSWEGFCGLYFLLLPLIIVFRHVNQFSLNEAKYANVTYTFGESGLKLQGFEFTSNFSWSHIIKYKELGNFLVLYHTKRLGNYVDKANLTSAQLSFIKSKVLRR